MKPHWLGPLIRKHTREGVLDWLTLEAEIEDRYLRMDRTWISLVLCFLLGIVFSYVVMGLPALSGALTQAANGFN